RVSFQSTLLGEAKASAVANRAPIPLGLPKDIKMSLTSQRRPHLTTVVCLDVVQKYKMDKAKNITLYPTASHPCSTLSGDDASCVVAAGHAISTCHHQKQPYNKKVVIYQLFHPTKQEK
ncbi:MAG: hypothetical protein IJ163_01100, partial [Bacteroidaceae bacterium]|nr:hypothetical protein [Bacteroidaceae bacterium]